MWNEPEFLSHLQLIITTAAFRVGRFSTDRMSSSIWNSDVARFKCTVLNRCARLFTRFSAFYCQSFTGRSDWFTHKGSEKQSYPSISRMVCIPHFIMVFRKSWDLAFPLSKLLQVRIKMSIFSPGRLERSSPCKPGCLENILCCNSPAGVRIQEHSDDICQDSKCDAFSTRDFTSL
jgi:hypothetical protein